MTRGYSGGKRQREADRDRRKKEKRERLRMNRAMGGQGNAEPSAEDVAAAIEQATTMPEVKLEDIVIGVPQRPKRSSIGPVKLFVGGLSWDISTDELRTAFSKFGNVVDATVILDRGTGRSRGFGFVTFENPPDAANAVKEMDGKELAGRILKVNQAESR
jgi:RNA recognition motif-containing protein